MLKGQRGLHETHKGLKFTLSFGDQKDVKPEKHTGFTFRGREIVLSKTRGAPLHGKKKAGWYSDRHRIEAVALYATTGDLKEVHRLTSIPKETLRNWMKQNWALDLLEEIRAENDHKIDAKFNEIVDKAIDVVGERLTNGDFVLNKHGELIRKPVGAKDAALVMAINLDKRQLLRGKPTQRQENISNDSRLEKLVEQFTRIAKKQAPQPLEIEDVEYQRVENAIES